MKERSPGIPSAAALSQCVFGNTRALFYVWEGRSRLYEEGGGFMRKRGRLSESVDYMRAALFGEGESLSCAGSICFGCY